MSLKIPKRFAGVKTISHARSPKQEKDLAKRLGARRVGGSGCGTVKGDVRLKRVVRIECKNTLKDSFRVTFGMLEKIEHAALGSDELPVIQIEFVDAKGVIRKDCCVVPSYVLDILTAKTNE
jgi:hypothetical protein